MRASVRILAVCSAAAIGLVPAVAGGSAAAEPPSGADRFTRAPEGLAIIHSPLGLTNQPATYVVEVAGDPITVTDAATDSTMTDPQKQSRRSQLRQTQAPVALRVRELGGSVVGSYQNAYNGLKVRMTPSQAAAISVTPNVVAVHRVVPMKPANTRGVPLIGAPAVWDGLNGLNGLHGEGVKVAVIDTGIDWTHADFGGAGTAAAYEAAHATETQPAHPAYFGPDAPKVKGGIDLVGDSYNADPNSPGYQPVPHPDPNPLDCNGHGTHVSGTAVGFGVTADGKTYAGRYNSTTIGANKWKVGPGVAPKADLYGIRIFGCDGSTDVTIDAIEWAVDHDMDVINMSLGSPWGSADDPAARASDNAARNGVIVVASAGNDGPAPYMSGSPGSASRVITVTASDPVESFPGATIALSTGPSLTAINANGATLPAGALPIKVLRNSAGGISLGCTPAEYAAAGVTGAIVVTTRGDCARVARAVYGQQAGAAAVLMVNNAEGYPPYEGPITGNPDTGEAYNVTIPFLGVSSTDAGAIAAADGGTATLTGLQLNNPGYLANASFSSGGPRVGDSALKPTVTAPGVSTVSAGVGTGNGAETLSGTSMAAPHTAGLAALVRQAHPNWRRTSYWKAAIENTADPAKVAGYTTRVAGSGLIQAAGATRTQVVATGNDGSSALNFGFAELGGDYRQALSIQLRNLGAQPVTFQVGTDRSAGSPHTVSPSRSSIRVPARGSATVSVTLRVPAATAGTSAAFADVAGLITFTPAGTGNGGVALRVPYYLVPQAVSNISTTLNTSTLVRTGTATATVGNRKGAVAGTADWYAWGLSDPRDRGIGSSDVRAVGMQTFPDDRTLAIGIATHKRWSNAAQNEYDVFVDVNGDRTDDYAVVGADLGLLTTGSPDGQMAVAVFDLRTQDGSIEFLAAAPTDSTTLVLPVLFDQLCAEGSPCLLADNPRLTYHVVSFGQAEDAAVTDVVNGSASFNAFTPAVDTGMFATVNPNATATVPVHLNRSELPRTRPLGFMIVSPDNPSTGEAQLIGLPVRG